MLARVSDIIAHPCLYFCDVILKKVYVTYEYN